MHEVMAIGDRLAEIIISAAGGAVATLVGAFTLVRNVPKGLHDALGPELRGLIVAGVIAAIGLIMISVLLDAVDVTPLDGFWVKQPIPVSVLASLIGTGLVGMARYIDRRNHAQHQETKEYMRHMLADHTTAEEAIVGRLEAKVDTILAFMRGRQ